MVGVAEGVTVHVGMGEGVRLATTVGKTGVLSSEMVAGIGPVRVQATAVSTAIINKTSVNMFAYAREM